MKTWNIDQAHSEVGFKIKHMMVSTVRGQFTRFEGSITSPDDDFVKATISFTAETNSINTNNDMRDKHLVASDFFDAEKFPKISFVSTKIEKKGENDFMVLGDLDMHGVKKEISLEAKLDGITEAKDGRIMGFEITGSLSRKDFGLTWNAATETGGVVLSDEVRFDMNIECKEA